MGFFAGLIRHLHSCREAEFGRSATPQEIELAEEQLGVELPESYKAFLGHFGWVSLEGLELYGLGDDVPAYREASVWWFSGVTTWENLKSRSTVAPSLERGLSEELDTL